MKAIALHRLSKIIGLLPLLVGTIIFWTWFYDPKNRDLMASGLLLVMVSVPLCLIGLICVFIVRRKNKENRIEKRKTTFPLILILINIPFAIVYLCSAEYLMDFERITVINNSENTISELVVEGCGDRKEINELKQGEKETVWIHMQKEGSIKMNYIEKAEKKSRTIEGYIGKGDGNKINVHIKATCEDILKMLNS